MITYVNTVLVGTGVGSVASAMTADECTKGKYIVVDNDGVVIPMGSAKLGEAEAIKVGLCTGKTLTTHDGTKVPVIKWSNIIKKTDVKSFSLTKYSTESEDVVTIDLSNATINADYRYVVRLTYKDLPTRYRKWSDSYEVSNITTKAELAEAIANRINDEAKRARVIAVATTTSGSEKVVLTAMPYSDDDSVESISPAAKVRFNVNMWYTNPKGEFFASKNKYATGAVITKVPGNAPVGAWKVVRDAEAQAMGYNGIINRGQGTWPIIKPAMNVVEDQTYDTFTLEFENMYRTADDLQRKTKQTLQVFEQVGAGTPIITGTGAANGLASMIVTFLGNESESANATAKGTSDTADKNTKYSA